MHTPSAKPECPYCGATEGLRYLHRGYGPVAPEFICEADFTPRDDGPCFDDLPAVTSWPKHSDGSNMTIGEMSPEDRRTQFKASAIRVMGVRA